LYGLKKKIEKNKSQYGENLSRTFDRAPSVVYKSSIFPTVRFLVSEKKLKKSSFLCNFAGHIDAKKICRDIFRVKYCFLRNSTFLRAEIFTTVLPYGLLKMTKKSLINLL
jgi:hypothetical protein